MLLYDIQLPVMEIGHERERPSVPPDPHNVTKERTNATLTLPSMPTTHATHTSQRPSGAPRT